MQNKIVQKKLELGYRRTLSGTIINWRTCHVTTLLIAWVCHVTTSCEFVTSSTGTVSSETKSVPSGNNTSPLRTTAESSRITYTQTKHKSVLRFTNKSFSNSNLKLMAKFEEHNVQTWYIPLSSRSTYVSSCSTSVCRRTKALIRLRWVEQGGGEG